MLIKLKRELDELSPVLCRCTYGSIYKYHGSCSLIFSRSSVLVLLRAAVFCAAELWRNLTVQSSLYRS